MNDSWTTVNPIIAVAKIVRNTGLQFVPAF